MASPPVDKEQALLAKYRRVCEMFPTLPHFYITNAFEKSRRNLCRIEAWIKAYQAADKRLGNRITALPQELQDIIFDFCIFSRPVDGVTNITLRTKTPLGLQIDRATRSRFAREYYGSGSIFEFENAYEGYGKDICELWLRSLPVEHAHLIHILKVHQGPLPRGSRAHWPTSFIRPLLMSKKEDMRKSNEGLRAGVLFMTHQYLNPDRATGERWINCTEDLLTRQVRTTWLREDGEVYNLKTRSKHCKIPCAKS